MCHCEKSHLRFATLSKRLVCPLNVVSMVSSCCMGCIIRSVLCLFMTRAIIMLVIHLAREQMLRCSWTDLPCSPPCCMNVLMMMMMHLVPPCKPMMGSEGWCDRALVERQKWSLARLMNNNNNNNSDNNNGRSWGGVKEGLLTKWTCKWDV